MSTGRDTDAYTMTQVCRQIETSMSTDLHKDVGRRASLARRASLTIQASGGFDRRASLTRRASQQVSGVGYGYG